MKELQQIREACTTMNEAKTLTPEAEKYIGGIQSSIKNLFPNSAVKVSGGSGIGSDSIFITFTIGKDKSEWSNGISQNDPMYHSIIIHGIVGPDGNINDGKFQTDAGIARLSVKPEEGSYMAFDNIKTGWRKFSLPADKIPARLDKYFKNLKKLAKDNIDRFTDNDIDVVKRNLK